MYILVEFSKKSDGKTSLRKSIIYIEDNVLVAGDWKSSDELFEKQNKIIKERVHIFLRGLCGSELYSWERLTKDEFQELLFY